MLFSAGASFGKGGLASASGIVSPPSPSPAPAVRLRRAPGSPARGPPADCGELIQAHDDREAVQVSPDELPVIDIHSL